MRFCFKKIKAFAILVCTFISFVAFGCGFGMLYKTAAEDVVTEITNPGFETLAGNMPADWTTWVALNEKDESIANVTFSVVSGSDAHSGTSLKCVNKSGDSMIRGVVNSAEFKVAGGKTYLLSFYYRSDSSTAMNSLASGSLRATVTARKTLIFGWIPPPWRVQPTDTDRCPPRSPPIPTRRKPCCNWISPLREKTPCITTISLSKNWIT